MSYAIPSQQTSSQYQKLDFSAFRIATPILPHTVIDLLQSSKMMSMRAFARSAPRSLTRLSSAALRQTAVARPSSLVKSTSWAPLRSSQFTSAFSTSQFRNAPANEVDDELSAKLESELQYENELKDSEPTPASVKDFLENSPFELIDTPGKEDVILKRKFGNET
jgi:complement component 1 Q subcomponent-binding protein, mitochondrial